MLFALATVPLATVSAQEAASKSPSPVVVELFTSQGCSSCPPADRLLVGLDEIAKKHRLPVYCLSFHVDYWNSLGWRDPYSSEQFTQRQRRYAAVLKARGIYTPQMIVNGETEFVGSRARDAQQAIESRLAAPTKVALEINAQWSSDKSNVSIDYQLAELPPKTLLNMALVQGSAKNSIPRGENAGRELAHVQVVREFQTIPLKSNSGKTTLKVPAALSSDKLSVVAYVQDARSMAILGASGAEF